MPTARTPRPDVTVTHVVTPGGALLITGALTTPSADVDSRSTRALIRNAVKRAFPGVRMHAVSGGGTFPKGGTFAETRIIFYGTPAEDAK